MNPINRIGQKVICVSMPWVMACTRTEAPALDGIYTVDRFETWQGIPCIHLREVPPFNCCKYIANNVPWPISAFRPVDERKTDISEFERLLDVVDVKSRGLVDA